jgi:hypothetical protein
MSMVFGYPPLMLLEFCHPGPQFGRRCDLKQTVYQYRKTFINWRDLEMVAE